MSEPQTASNGPFVGKELSTHSFGVDDALVDDLMKAYNNLGVTLKRISDSRAGDPDRAPCHPAPRDCRLSPGR